MKLVLVIACVLFFQWSNAQDGHLMTDSDVKVLTIDDCIQIAMEKNIGLKRAQNNALIAKNNAFQSLMRFLPDLSAQINYDFNNGTYFDNGADRLVTGTTNSSSPGIGSNWILFNGFSNHYNRQSTDKTAEATENGIEEQKQTVRSTVLGAYLSVLLDKENITISEARLALLNSQLVREEKRLEIGVGNLEQVYNLKSQLAKEQLNLVNLNNSMRSDRLKLLQILQLDALESYMIAPYEFNDETQMTDLENFGYVLNMSMDYAPSIKRAKANVQSTSYALKRSKSSYLPTLSLYGQIGSRYSTNGALNIRSGRVEQAPYITQIDWNMTKYLNLQLSIPIFTNWRTATAVQNAKLNMYNSDLDLKQAEVEITNTVQKVYLDLISAQETYKAAQENLLALNQSFEYSKTRYESGSTDFYTYLESLNNKNRAEIELVNAKYSIVFRKKILDVYRGML